MNGSTISKRVLGPGSYCILGQIHIVCFSNVSSNGSTVWMQSHICYICLTFLHCVISERVLGPGSYCILGQIYFVYFAAAVLPQTIQENLLCNFQTSRYLYKLKSVD